MPETSKQPSPHEHAGEARSAPARLVVALGISSIFLCAELIGAALSNSLALFADAGHVATDIAALSVALVASRVATLPHSDARSYGSMRAEILAALANGIGLAVIAALIFVEAIGRLRAPQPVQALPMLVVAAGGLVANLVSTAVLMRGSGSNLNLRAAFLHVLSDAIGSVATMVAALVILVFGWKYADPLASMALAILLVVLAVRLILPAVHILLEGTPKGMDLPHLEEAILAQPGILQVHDLHAWTLSSGYNAVTAHVVVADTVPAGQREEVLDGLRHMIPGTFPVQHVTIQLEESSECCEEAHAPVTSTQGQGASLSSRHGTGHTQH